jgi:hypothetical protein
MNKPRNTTVLNTELIKHTLYYSNVDITNSVDIQEQSAIPNTSLLINQSLSIQPTLDLLYTI